MLETTAVSPAGRARFSAALGGGSGGADGARHLYALRFAEVFEASPSFGHAVSHWTNGNLEFLRWPLDWVGPFVFNRRLTLNRYGDLFTDLEEFAARRESAKAQQRVLTFMAQENRSLVKNMGGAWLDRLILNWTDLRNSKRIIEAYWAAEDERADLRARLALP